MKITFLKKKRDRDLLALQLQWWVRIRETICDGDLRITDPDVRLMAAYINVHEAQYYTQLAERDLQ